MKLLTLFILLSLLLSSCSKKNNENEAPSNEVVTVLEIRSTVPTPANVSKMRLTDLKTKLYVEKVASSDKSDTAKTTLSLSFYAVPKPFDAEVSVYYKDGTVRNTMLKEVMLLKGKKKHL